MNSRLESTLPPHLHHADELQKIDSQYDRYLLIVRVGKWLFVIVLALVMYRWWYPYQTFDSTAWKAADRWESNTRLGMASYLVKSRTLDGKAKAEVFELLGEPDDMRKPVGTHHTWLVGRGQSMFSFDSYLGIVLDQSDRVKECFMFEH